MVETRPTPQASPTLDKYAGIMFRGAPFRVLTTDSGGLGAINGQWATRLPVYIKIRIDLSPDPSTI